MAQGSFSERLKMASGAQQFAIIQRSENSPVSNQGFLKAATPANKLNEIVALTD